jgi:hypothetical protein
MVLLPRRSRVVHRRATEAVLGMRFKEYTSLTHLREHDGLTQQSLGEAPHVDANNCVLVLNELGPRASPSAAAIRPAGATSSRSRRRAGARWRAWSTRC